MDAELAALNKNLESIKVLLERIATVMENPPEFEMPEFPIKAKITEDVAFEKSVAEVREVAKTPPIQPEAKLEPHKPKAFRYRLMQIDAANKPIREPNFIIEADTFEGIKVLAGKLTEEKKWGILWTGERVV
jgi:hypothetical protein